MGMEDRFGRASREGLADTSKERLQHDADQRHLQHEVDRVHAEEEAERVKTPTKGPWWRFWARN